MEGLELSHALKDHLENWFLKGSPVEQESFKDITFHGENANIKRLQFLDNLQDILKNW